MGEILRPHGSDEDFSERLAQRPPWSGPEYDYSGPDFPPEQVKVWVDYVEKIKEGKTDGEQTH